MHLSLSVLDTSRVVATSQPRARNLAIMLIIRNRDLTAPFPSSHQGVTRSLKLELVESILGLILLDPLIPAAGHDIRGAGHDVVRGGDEPEPVLSVEAHDEHVLLTEVR